MLSCHRSRGIVASAAVVVMALMSSLGRSAIVVNDKWADADRTGPASPVYSEYGVDSDNDGDIESAWFNGGTGATSTASAGHLVLAPAAGGASSASFTTYYTPEATPVTLAAAGDFIHVQWKFTPGNVNAINTSQNFRLAVVDSGASTRVLSTADNAPSSGAFAGYAMFMNFGQTLNATNSFQLLERNAANSDLLGTSGNWTALGNGAGKNVTGYLNGTLYTYDMTITRNSLGGVDIVSTMSGAGFNNSGLASVSFTDATPNSFTYDTFGIRPSGALTTADTFDTTQFLVETNTNLAVSPEPASLLALAGGLIGAARRRR